MAYSQGGLISAADYWNLVGVSPSSTANQLNTVWAVGNGNAGYGQTAIANTASTGSTVTATQWASLINTLNSVLTHQSGAGSGLGAPTAGGTITYLSTLTTSVNTAYSNRLNYATQGSTTTGSVFNQNVNVAPGAGAYTWTFSRTITFASGNAARYFFNAGGQFNFVTTGTTNGAGNNRSGDITTLVGTYLANINNIRYNSNGGRSGTGGTVNTNNTALGYYNLTTSDQTIVQITSTTYPYNGDYVIVAIKSNGVQGSNADVGSVITLDFTVYSNATKDASGSKNLNVTWSHRIDTVVPETTNLSNSWGTITIA